jgi:hypothetical protein
MENQIERTVQKYLDAVGKVKKLTGAHSSTDSTLIGKGYSFQVREKDFQKIAEGREVIIDASSPGKAEKTVRIAGVRFFCFCDIPEEEWFKMKGYVKAEEAPQ